MQNGNVPKGIPIIGAMKMMDMEPFNIAALGWFYPDETITALHVAHLQIILISLMMPKPQNVDFRLKEYADEHDLSRFFKADAPASVKKLKEQGLLSQSTNEKTN